MAKTIGHQVEKRWLRCQLDKGMFSSEMAVTYPPSGSMKKSVFVPLAKVKGAPGVNGEVQVLIVHRDGKTFALLPSSQKELVEVNQSDIL